MDLGFHLKKFLSVLRRILSGGFSSCDVYKKYFREQGTYVCNGETVIFLKLVSKFNINRSNNILEYRLKGDVIME